MNHNSSLPGWRLSKIPIRKSVSEPDQSSCAQSMHKNELENVHSLLRPHKLGWSRDRSTGSMVYFTPTGQSCHSLEQIQDYLDGTGSTLTIDCFSFDKELDSLREYDSLKNGIQILIEVGIKSFNSSSGLILIVVHFNIISEYF